MSQNIHVALRVSKLSRTGQGMEISASSLVQFNYTNANEPLKLSTDVYLGLLDVHNAKKCSLA